MFQVSDSLRVSDTVQFSGGAAYVGVRHLPN